MATKLKNSNVLKNLMCAVLILALAASVLASYSGMEKRAEQFETHLWDTYHFGTDLVNKSMWLYWQMNSQNGKLSPQEVLAPEFLKETRELEEKLHTLSAGDMILQNSVTTEPNMQTEANDETDRDQAAIIFQSDDHGAVTVVRQKDYEKLTDEVAQRNWALSEFDSTVENESWIFEDIAYWSKGENGKILAHGDDVSGLFEGTTEQQKKQLKEYQFAVKLHFDEEGYVRIQSLWTGDQPSDEFRRVMWDLNESGGYRELSYNQPIYAAEEERSVRKSVSVQGPRNMDVVFAVPHQFAEPRSCYWEIMQNKRLAFRQAGGVILFAAAMILVALAGFVLGAVRRLNMGNGRFLRHMPVELLIALDVFAILGYIPLEWLTTELQAGQMGWMIASRWMLNEQMILSGMEVCRFLLLAAVLTAAFVSFLSYGKLIAAGPAAYLKERSWIVRFVRWLARGCKHLWCKATAIRLDAPARKALGGAVLVNLAVMILASCIWFGGIVLAIGYAVFLYVFLKKRYRQVQSDYHKVLELTDQMAQGNLDAHIESDVGVFQPLAGELAQVRTGFKKAVDAELRSQNMKTELITNVSHDLKTPLTAIITYVDLLKKPDITEQERTSYIETLDKKSQRLKQLIADLFEMSKAASRDVNLQPEQLDLCALLGQVRFELSDKLENCGVDFRWDLTEEKVLVRLDGPHTCRIFENLLVNITKYAMPGTRAYVTLKRSENEVQVSFKNISAAELNLDEQHLTERFVRGDASRSTEGSGLGLAIAKSFVELQNGKFELTADGDLFKVVIAWPVDNTDEAVGFKKEQQTGEVPVKLPENL